jgi:hypothetical protein
MLGITAAVRRERLHTGTLAARSRSQLMMSLFGDSISCICFGGRPTPKPTPKRPTPKPTPKRPTPKPTAKPTLKPTAKPTLKPTAKPTLKPTAKPTAKPTPKPTAKATTAPTYAPPSICCLHRKHQLWLGLYVHHILKRLPHLQRQLRSLCRPAPKTVAATTAAPTAMPTGAEARKAAPTSPPTAATHNSVRTHSPRDVRARADHLCGQHAVGTA